MSSLTTETREVWIPILYGIDGSEIELAECHDESLAVIRAQEAIREFIVMNNTYCYCKIEHRIVPIYS